MLGLLIDREGVPYVDNVFTLITLLVIGACAAGDLVDGDAVYVACGTSQVDCLLRTLLGAAA